MNGAALRVGLAGVLALALGGGCFLTQDEFNRQMKDFDEYLKKREERVQAENEAQRKELDKRVNELRRALQSFETTLKRMKEDLDQTKSMTGAAIETAAKVQTLVDEAGRALEQIRLIEGRLNRRMGDTVEKYREVLLEEKRVLMEQLRAVNESLRNLKPENGEEEKEGD